MKNYTLCLLLTLLSVCTSNATYREKNIHKKRNCAGIKNQENNQNSNQNINEPFFTGVGLTKNFYENNKKIKIICCKKTNENNQFLKDLDKQLNGLSIKEFDSFCEKQKNEWLSLAKKQNDEKKYLFYQMYNAYEAIKNAKNIDEIILFAQQTNTAFLQIKSQQTK